MTGIEDAALLAVVAIGSALGASALPRASWPRRCPAAAILLWQALGLASGLAAVGTLIGLALPASQGGLVLSMVHAAGLLRDGELFSLARLFGVGQADGAPLVLGGVLLGCLGGAAGAAHAPRPRRPEGARRPRRGLPERGRVLPARAAVPVPDRGQRRRPRTARPRRAGRRAGARAGPPAGASRPGPAAVHRATARLPQVRHLHRCAARGGASGRDAG